jgi:hypothetical protein
MHHCTASPPAADTALPQAMITLSEAMTTLLTQLQADQAIPPPAQAQAANLAPAAHSQIKA